jgi:hypothetical protein
LLRLQTKHKASRLTSGYWLDDITLISRWDWNNIVQVPSMVDSTGITTSVQRAKKNDVDYLTVLGHGTVEVTLPLQYMKASIKMAQSGRKL